MKLRSLEWAVGAGLVALSITHWQPMGIHLLELLSAFPHFTLGISLVIGALALVQKRWALLAATCFAVALNALLILSAPVCAPDTSIEADITVAQMNVYAANCTNAQQFPFSELHNVDVVTIQELNELCHYTLTETLKSAFPHFVEEPWDTCCYGLGLYSKWPILAHEVVSVFDVPIIKAVVRCNDVDLTVITLHTMAPAFPDLTTERNTQLRAVSKMASEVVGPCIVLGDFNLVPWDREFKQFLRVGNLSSVRDGFQATYPMDFGIPLIPIDHVCYSDHFNPTECHVVTIPGSDHRGMVAGFSVDDR